MRVAVVSRWREAVNGFWLVPGLIAAGVALLAFATVGIDRGIDSGTPLGFDGDASAARDLLGVIAGSLITVSGLAFSITMVTLQLVSSQYTPRALRGLLADRSNQIVVGLFIGVFGYCLLVMRSVSEEAGGDPFVPGVAVTTAIALAFIALAALVYFIHHVGKTVQVSEIAGTIGRRALAGVEAGAVGDGGTESDEDPVPGWRGTGTPARCHAGRAGFVQSIDLWALARLLACESDDVRVHVVVKPGDFVTAADVVLEAWPREALAETIEDAQGVGIVVADERDDVQDPGYPVRLLADIALRALSPGVNDPTTAVTAIGYLRAALERSAALPDPPRTTVLAEDRVTFASAGHRFADLLDEGVEELSRTVGTYAYRPLLHLLDTVEREARDGPRPERAELVEPYRRAVLAARAAAG